MHPGWIERGGVSPRIRASSPAYAYISRLNTAPAYHTTQGNDLFSFPLACQVVCDIPLHPAHPCTP